jgi:hypothetical protein
MRAAGVRITVRELGRANTFGSFAIPMYTLKISDHINSGYEKLERSSSDGGRFQENNEIRIRKKRVDLNAHIGG